MSRRSGTISIEVSEFIGEICDDDLLDEVSERKLVVGTEHEAVPLDLVEEAHLELLRGRPDEARALLDRLLLPKWRHKKAAEKAYDMFRKGKRA